MKLPTIVALEELNVKDGILTFKFKSQDGRSHYVPLKVPVLNAMLPTILNVANSDPEPGSEVQPVTLTAARAAVMADGTKCIAVHLDEVPLAIAVSESAIRKLKTILLELEVAGKRPQTRH